MFRHRVVMGPVSALKARKIGFCPATTLSGSTVLPFVISTGADRISYFAKLATSTDAALRIESRMQSINVTAPDRKSGGA